MGSSTNIILIVVVVGIIIFAIISSIYGRKNQKAEKEKRKREVKQSIKNFIKKENNIKNVIIDYNKVVARKGKDYKYRDVFDVIVKIRNPKEENKVIEKAFEIEGISKKINKKDYTTTWVVNRELDLVSTKKQISIAENTVKLTKEEKQERKQTLKEQETKILQEEKKIEKENKQNYKNNNPFKSSEPIKKPKGIKFIHEGKK